MGTSEGSALTLGQMIDAYMGAQAQQVAQLAQMVVGLTQQMNDGQIGQANHHLLHQVRGRGHRGQVVEPGTKAVALGYRGLWEGEGHPAVQYDVEQIVGRRQLAQRRGVHL